MPPPGWDAFAAASACEIGPWRGSVWRAHAPKYHPLSHGGSLRVSGRWHRAENDPRQAAWPALYTAPDLGTCAFEVQRAVLKENGEPARLLRYRYTEIWVELRRVLDCRDARVLGLGEADLDDDRDYRVPQLVALAARQIGAEGLLVCFASAMGDNLVIFPDLRRPDSVLEPLRSLDPRLPSPASVTGEGAAPSGETPPGIVRRLGAQPDHRLRQIPASERIDAISASAEPPGTEARCA